MQPKSGRKKRDEQIWRFRTPKDLQKYSKEIQFLRRLTRLSGRRMSVPAQLARNITSRKRPSSDKDVIHEYIRKDCDPDALHTFIRVSNPNFVLHARNLRNRLVITLPDHLHELRSTRFFLIIQSRNANITNLPTFSANGETIKFSKYSVYDTTHQDITPHLINATIGSLVFRQDQLHIDLFVFFSVFFSCFFLFLSFCVIVWKFKAMSDLRTARRRHAVEMQYMAQRPFASQIIMFEQNKPPALAVRSQGKHDNPQIGCLGLEQHRAQQLPLFEPYHNRNQQR